MPCWGKCRYLDKALYSDIYFNSLDKICQHFKLLKHIKEICKTSMEGVPVYQGRFEIYFLRISNSVSVSLRYSPRERVSGRVIPPNEMRFR